MLHKKLFLFLLSILIFGCSDSSPIDLVENKSELNSISYDNNVKQIIANNCINCHGIIPTSGAPMSLNSLTTLKDAIQNRGLINRINLEESNIRAMPLGGPKLLPSQIETIVKWQNEGFAN